ncbi:HAD-IA family hydrolase [Muricauda sp. JGD-17]|uniref:HAD-IA family hydrolase n=1 Tax=Flagellimonas ochracea TaxID=2696472 RepID=A0A964T9G9_9FLAO|nr:HAD family phosphatase [Allomuricauda ochracea]NAY90694.1 HAD-IA family hydrolase [Allomuricauda ochracea]
MIKNIILDFGDVLINLDKTATARIMQRYGFTRVTPELDSLFKMYEKGQLETPAFLEQVAVHFPKAGMEDLKKAWNSILLDFPEHRLRFLEGLAEKNRHRLFLLSNTNALHMECVRQQMGRQQYNRFKNVFEGFYLSHEIGMRKPDREIFEFVLKKNNLVAAETLFVDDTLENTDAAIEVGIKTWHLKVGEEEVTQLDYFIG